MTTDSGNQSGNPAGNRAADQATWLAALEETLGAGAAALDADGRLDDVSHGFARILRAYPGQLLEELVDAEQRPELAAALAAVGAGALEHTLTLRRDERALALSLRRPAAPGGPLLAVVRDRTSEDRIERTVRQAERLRIVGEMALGWAHELSNLMNTIVHLAELPEGPRDADLALLRTSVADARDLVVRLQTFGRPDAQTDAQVLDPRELLSEALEFTRVRWQRPRQRIEVHSDLQPSGTIRAARAELRHALVNLIVNAIDAMPRGGRLRVACRREGDRVVLEVADTGTGMPAEVSEHIFDPFFSTKGERGLGLGLSIARTSVHRFGGTLRARSKPGEGSAFEIRLPALGPVAGPAPAAAAAGDAPTPPLHVLVVDDNAPLRRLVVRLLEEDGHRVEEAGSAEEVEAAGRDLGALDLLVLDVSLPGRSGLELIPRLRARGYTGPILLATAWGIDLGSVGDGAVQVLHKPFRRDGLRDAIASLRGARSDSA